MLSSFIQRKIMLVELCWDFEVEDILGVVYNVVLKGGRDG